MELTPLELYRANRRAAYKKVLAGEFWDNFAAWAEAEQKRAIELAELIRGLHQACYGGNYPGPEKAIEQIIVYMANLHGELDRLKDDAVARETAS